MLQTIQAAGRVLDLFTVEAPEHGVTDVARQLAMPKSRVHSLLTTLAEIGLLRRTPGGRYRVGWRVLTLGRVLNETSELHRHALAVMRELSRRSGETVHLAALEGDSVVYLERLEGTRAVRIAVSGVGSMLPAHCSGVGKTLLAHRPAEEVEQLVERVGLPRFTENTITDGADLFAELEAIRARGWGHDREEAVPEVCCVAAPILDPTGRALAAMSIAVPVHRFASEEEPYRRAIVRAARLVGRRLASTSSP